jgi:hypothetical protein
VELVRINRDLNAALKGKQTGINTAAERKLTLFLFHDAA